MTMYRINYGNGQVSNRYENIKDAVKEFYAQVEYDRQYSQPNYHQFYKLEYFDGNEWHRPEYEVLK